MTLVIVLLALLGLPWFVTAAEPTSESGKSGTSQDGTREAGTSGDNDTPDKAGDERDGVKPPDAEPLGQAPKENPFGELLDDISGNMKRIEDLLNQRSTGSSTQDLEQQTVEKIDELIRKLESMGGG